MVVPAFGFGAGDFISAIQLINKAAKGLRDTGGAATNYQATALELSRLGSLLRRVEQLQPTTTNAVIVEDIRVLSRICQLPLERFVKEIRKFEASLGASAAVAGHRNPAQRFRNVGRKLHWAIVIESEAAKLKTSIGPQLEAINSLLQLELLQQTTDSNRATHETHDHAKRLLSRVDELNNVVRTNVATQDQAANLITRMEELSLEQSRKLGEAVDVSQDSNSRLNDIQDRFNTQERLLRDIMQHLDSGASSRSHASGSSPSRWSAASRVFAKDLSAHADAVTIRFVEVLISIRTSLDQILLMLLCLAPFAQRFFRILKGLARAPRLLLGNNIELEDALGRIKSLPYEYFRSWPVFEAWLREAFVGYPGESEVKKNQFHILNMRAGGNLVMTKKNWSRAISPGAKVAMSILFPSTFFRERSCPGCNLSDADEAVGRWIQCERCSLIYRVLPRPSGPREEGISILDFDQIWEQLKSLEFAPAGSYLQQFKRIHLIGQSSEQLGLPEDIFREYQSLSASSTSNIQAFNLMLQQFNELQQQTMIENLEMQKAQAFWNPLESMSKKDATS